MFHSGKRAFYNSTDTMELGPIDISRYCDFARYWFSHAGVRLDGDTFDTLYNYFEGNTFCIQRLLHEAYSVLEKGDICTKEVLWQCLKEILSNNSSSYREMLSRLTTKQKAVLAAIALDSKASRVTSAAFLRKHHLESASMVQTALRVLKEEEWVSDSGNVYTLSDQFFALWIQTQHGIEKQF